MVGGVAGGGRLGAFLFLDHEADHERGEAVFLVGLAVVFGYQIVEGVRLGGDPARDDLVSTIAMLVVACFVIGVYRAWDPVGGPSFHVAREMRVLFSRGESGQ